MALSEEARQAKNAYQRNWHKEHPGRASKYVKEYWERKAGIVLQREAKKLSVSGHSQREIAELLNTSASSVNRMLKDVSESVS